MSGRYLLDTKVVIALFAGDPSVVERLKHAQEVFLSSIVVGELYYGVLKSSRAKDNLARLDDF